MQHIMKQETKSSLVDKIYVSCFARYLMARYIEILDFRQYEVSRKLELNIHTFIVSKYFYDCIFSFPVGYQNNSFTTRFRVPKCSPPSYCKSKFPRVVLRIALNPQKDPTQPYKYSTMSSSQFSFHFNSFHVLKDTQNHTYTQTLTKTYTMLCTHTYEVKDIQFQSQLFR